MKKVMKAIATVAALVLLDTLIFGCTILDLNGDGEVNPITYLEGVDITVGWVDESGEVYNVALDEFGKQIVGRFIQAKTGYLFEVDDNGGITVTDPDGVSINLKQKALVEE